MQLHCTIQFNTGECVFLPSNAGADAAVLQGEYEIAEICNVFGMCTSGNTRAYLIFFSAGIMPALTYCCAFFCTCVHIGQFRALRVSQLLKKLLDAGGASPPFECCIFIGKGAMPRCEYEMVVDERSLSRAQDVHTKRIRELENQIETEKETSELIHFELQTGDTVINVEAYPDCSVAALESVLHPDEDCRLTLACASLPKGATLDSQGITNDTRLEAEHLCTTETTVLVPSSLELVLEHEISSEPRPKDHMKQKTKLVCCSWKRPGHQVPNEEIDRDMDHARL